MSEITGRKNEKTLIRVNNKSAIALTKNPVFPRRSKHIHKRYHVIRECIEGDQLDLEHVPGKDQLADILTKALAKILFKEMRDRTGV